MVGQASRILMILGGALGLGLAAGYAFFAAPSPRIPQEDRVVSTWDLPQLPDVGQSGRWAREIGSADWWGGRLAVVGSARESSPADSARAADLQIAQVIQRWRFLGSAQTQGRRTALLLDPDNRLAHLDEGEWLFDRFELVSIEMDQILLQSAESVVVSLHLFGDNEIDIDVIPVRDWDMPASNGEALE